LQVLDIASLPPHQHGPVEVSNTLQIYEWVLIMSAANCQANPGFVPIATGGDGSSVQYWFVGYNPSSQEVIVSHQGTDPSQL
jgi:hypothetical protein